MHVRDGRQATLLDRYWALLRRNRRAVPPAGLDPEIADLAARLERNLAAPAPTSAYAENMRRRLNAQADRLATGETIDQPTRPRGATRPNGPRPMTPTQLQPRESRPMQPSSVPPTPLEPRKPWYNQYGKLAAAIAIFAVVGIILVLVLRDDDDPQTAQPLPTTTPAAAATATAVPTQAAVAPTVAPPTATVPVAPALGEAFSVSVTNVVIPEGYAYLDIERLGWQPFAGSESNAITLGSFLSYQEAGTESCGKSLSSVAQVYRADGSGPETISNFGQPATLVNAGDHVVMPANTGFNCSNVSAEPSLAWAGGVLRGDPGPSTGHQRNPEQVAPGSLDTVVAGADAPGLSAGEATLTLERIIIEPGESAPGGVPAWTLIYAESGAVSVAVGGATEELAEGESTLVVGDASYELINGGDTAISIIVFTVLPEAGAATAAPFNVSARIEALPEESDYLSIDRMSWRAFGGTDENMVTNAATLTYQDIGVEACISSSELMTVLHSDGSSEAMSSDLGAPTTIQPGDGYFSPSTTGLNCKNTTQDDSTSLWLSIHRGGEPGIQDNANLPGGVSYEVIAHGPATGLPTGPVLVTLQRVVVAPGESLSALTGSYATIAVESGTLHLQAAGGEAVTRGPDATSIETLAAGAEADLAAGDGVTLPAESAATLTNTGAEPITVLIATVKAAQ